MSGDTKRPRIPPNLRKPLEWVLSALVGAIIVDVAFHGGKLTQRVFDQFVFGPVYTIDVQVRSLAEGGLGFAFPRLMFESYREVLQARQPPGHLAFHPPELERLRICHPFKGRYPDAGKAFKAFTRRFPDCIATDIGTDFTVNVRPGPAMQQRDTLFFCGCSDIIIEEAARFELECGNAAAAPRRGDTAMMCERVVGLAQRDGPARRAP